MKEKKGVREWQVRREDIEGREEGEKGRDIGRHKIYSKGP